MRRIWWSIYGIFCGCYQIRDGDHIYKHSHTQWKDYVCKVLAKRLKILWNELISFLRTKNKRNQLIINLHSRHHASVHILHKFLYYRHTCSYEYTRKKTFALRLTSLHTIFFSKKNHFHLQQKLGTAEQHLTYRMDM